MKKGAERQRSLTTGLFGESAVLHWIFPEPAEADGATLDLLQAYLNDALYTELRVRRELSYGPWSERTAWANQGFMSLNADVERDQEKVTQQALKDLVDKIRHDGLDPQRFARIQRVARAQLAWSTPGNSTLADYYWGALADFDDGKFPDEDKRLARVSLTQANDVAQQLFKDEGYLRIEKPLLDDDRVYPLSALVALLLAVLVGLALRRGGADCRRAG